MTITDFIAIILSIFFLERGASRGLMRSLLGPFSMIVATIMAIVYYQATQDMVVSLLIGLFGPILLHLILKFLLNTFAKATNTNIRPGFLSSLGGAILTLTWGWVFVVLTLTLLPLLPARGATLTVLHNDITNSFSYKITAPWVEKFIPALKGMSPDTKNVASKSDAQSLAQDPRFQEILQDPEVQKDINDHDFTKLLSNPKMMALTQKIMSDPEMLKKVMAVYRSQTQQQPQNQ